MSVMPHPPQFTCAIWLASAGRVRRSVAVVPAQPGLTLHCEVDGVADGALDA